MLGSPLVMTTSECVVGYKDNKLCCIPEETVISWQVGEPAVPCPGCGKKLANGGSALKAHAWSKPSCRRFLPSPMQQDILAEEQLYMSAAACPGCGKKIANADDALKAHGWSKPDCRRFLPRLMQREIAMEEQEALGIPTHKCPGCGKKLADGNEALKSHGWAKPDCRRFLPRAMQDDISAEEAELESAQTCPGCNKKVADGNGALKAHAWAKPRCRHFLPMRMQREIAVEEEIYNNMKDSTC